MKSRHVLLCLAGVVAALAGPPAFAGGRYAAPSASQTADTELVDRFIVKLRGADNADPQPRLTALAGTFGERLVHVRKMSGEAHVVRLGRRLMRREAQDLARLLAADPRVAIAEADVVMHPFAVPNDTYYAQQWHYFEPRGGINLPAAWDVSTGSAQLNIAVLDSGVLPHADLAGRLAPGYDFISAASASNDGDGRDADASDPGDYGCDASTSSWHGTHVAGTIGAASNNGLGVTGINWVSRIVPVRVLGRCGGYTSDIVDGMRWAVGMSVAGVAVNPNPARVLNLSFGADGICSNSFQNAVTDVVARGAVVVVAAGNSNAEVAGTQPASCNGVIAVAATTRSGGRAGYSNFGAKVTIAAPGGGGDGVLSTVNSGVTTPGADSYGWYQGTSMAAPHVSGVASLMLSVAPSLTPAQVTALLRQAARSFPSGTGSDCDSSACGAGIVDAAASLAAVAAVVSPPPAGGTVWSKVADEGQAFAVGGTQTVRYGSGSYWVTRSVTGSGACSNAFFGTDPIVGVYKQCEVASGEAPAPPPAGWSRIAGEGEGFSVAGTKTVRYGSGSSWISRIVTGTGACTNGFFGGDPLYGVAKQCELSSSSTPAVGWVPIASEGEVFNVSGTQTVRYGNGLSWVLQSVTTTGTCTNGYFGSDPLYGVAKRCEMASTAAAASGEPATTSSLARPLARALKPGA